ncbi:hypothetical protein [Vibrio metschnikovii]|uniref:Uncharacterized protein n=2 Tax=Bacteria TaxID=2 RepID=A0A9X0R939_VIBME|nr:hypothetical protein [Vibrio metschnikovii]EKO3589324.1 hypothetical protein [Vibrio metschnikovii]EKO3735969.1 hypothetical protein [Vibrio metschnikovii]EKO3745995.1 hypothetical protein [Vibrio metschnikovii]EKO3747425.1 hypothetical protein [Vibrio metschnikovii]EKO3927282.1 hypothetical protein [Vibrio metschnikovii]
MIIFVFAERVVNGDNHHLSGSGVGYIHSPQLHSLSILMGMNSLAA